MRTAANILSSAPAMQIRYLDTMQSMAKTANSKVIFLPAINQTVPEQLAAADSAGEGPSSYGLPAEATGASTSSNPGQQNPFDPGVDGFQQAMNARVVENI